MRALVQQRNSDTSTTPKKVFAIIPPSVFFTICSTPAFGSTMVVEGFFARCITEAENLEIMFPPSDEELATDEVVHPFYGHSMRSRWHRQHFDLDIKEIDKVTNERVPWTAQQSVINGFVTLQYNLRTLQLHVLCSWAGRCKKPNIENGRSWIEGHMNLKNRPVVVEQQE